MKISWFWADMWQEWISSMWRTQFPHAALVQAGYESRLDTAWSLTQDTTYHEVDDWADVIVLERLLFEPWTTHIRRWKKQGKRVFATFDDAYWAMPDYVRSKETWNKAILTEFRHTLDILDGVIIPSHGLSKALRRFGHYPRGQIHVIPNRPDLLFPAYQYALEFPKVRTDDRFVIGWGGSHHHSIKQLIPIFKRLIKEEPRVQIWIVGNYLAFNLLEEIPPDNKRALPICPYGIYLSLIKQFDAFAIPLSGRYDQSRSWIKPLEAALMSVPWVATKNRIYEDCRGGVLVKNGQEWYEALLSPIAADQEWALSQGVADHIGEYLEVFSG